MKVSTRNQLKGSVSSIIKGAVNSEVVLKISEGSSITSIITNGAVEKLGLKEGGEATALIKASNVIIGIDAKSLSARNVLCGKVSSIVEGPVNCEVSIDVNGATITSIITKGSCNRLGLAEGKEACAIIKATTVILVIE